MSSVLAPPSTRCERLRLRAEGAVQGVGFRPWVMRQAQSLGLTGWVRNDGDGLLCELQGQPQALLQFQARLATEPPPLARIRRLQRERLQPLSDEREFRINASAQAPHIHTLVPPDAATCEACLDEMFTPGQRRWRHPFINCTHCGPRFTLTERLPYDRAVTSMADFLMCDDCAAEYALPTDRRYHAQPIACPQCGPRVALWAPDGQVLIDAAQGPDAVVAEAVRRLRAGQVIALKGVGGYHLVADALQSAPLQRLREAKHRASKPFAVMTANLASARRWLMIDDAAVELLQAPARPIVLQHCRPEAAAAHPFIAPGLTEWGLMLPSHPLQWLLLHEWAGRPTDPQWRQQPLEALLMMTSANPGGEPLVIDEADAVARLGGLADALLLHDRAILARADDSVRRPLGRDAQGRFFAPFIRRARGHVPDPIELPGVAANAPCVLAMGGDLKNTVCLTRGNEAFLSPHLGDMHTAASRDGLSAMVDRLCRFLAVQPSAVVHDLHPDFFCTRHGQALASQWRVPTVAVQHHHAHAAAVLGEHGHTGPALALVLDGVGWGRDGTPWGGEWLRLDLDDRRSHGSADADFTRITHLSSLPLPGGDRAAREPWRMGAAVLHRLGRADEIALRFAGESAAAALHTLLDRGLNSPATTSAGRLFDAAAALLLNQRHNHHEAEAAMRLEAAATRHGTAEAWAHTLLIDREGRPDLTGLWQALADATSSPTSTTAADEAAARFHASLANLLVATTAHHARSQRLRTIALGGGCWVNRILREAVVHGLRAQGLQVLEASRAPCGDGGLSLGQATVALTRQAPHPGRRSL